MNTPKTLAQLQERIADHEAIRDHLAAADRLRAKHHGPPTDGPATDHWNFLLEVVDNEILGDLKAIRKGRYLRDPEQEQED